MTTETDRSWFEVSLDLKRDLARVETERDALRADLLHETQRATQEETAAHIGSLERVLSTALAERDALAAELDAMTSVAKRLLEGRRLNNHGGSCWRWYRPVSNEATVPASPAEVEAWARIGDSK